MDDLSKKDLEEAAQAQGAKLGYLISTLNVSDKIKDSFLAVLPQMSLDQIGKLIELLEQNYVQQKTMDLDQKLEEELKKIKGEHNQEIKEVNDNVASQLDDLINQI